MAHYAQPDKAQIKYPRVLMIVPELGLPLSPEIDTLYPLGYNVQPIQGMVTRERIFAAIREREFDVIHYAGHSGELGIELSGSVILEAAGLVQIARGVKAKLIFLNGCANIQVGQVLVDEHIPFVICTLSNIDNLMARETAQLFYTHLAETGDIRAAFNLSKPPVKGAYAMLTNGTVDVSLAPIIEKLATFTIFMERNDSEHADILRTICDNESEHDRIMRVLLKSRVWNVAIMLAGMIGVGVIVGLMGLLGRGALP